MRFLREIARLIRRQPPTIGQQVDDLLKRVHAYDYNKVNYVVIDYYANGRPSTIKTQFASVTVRPYGGFPLLDKGIEACETVISDAGHTVSITVRAK